MVQWWSPQEIAKDGAVFSKLVFALFGVYIWEIIMTSDFEWSLITGRRRFRWPLLCTVFFFFCRYCMLLCFVGLIVSLSVNSKINCRALYAFNSWTGNMTILCASTSLMLRTIALWERRLSIILILGIPCVAHWALLYRTMFVVVAQWDPQSRACVVVQTNASLLNTTFFFTMAFDFLILVFTAVALLSRHSARTDLWKLLFKDGLVYFLVSFSTNCIPAVLNILNLNTQMNVIGTIPAAAITSIASCRAVMRLLDFCSNDHLVHTLSPVVPGTKPPILARPHLKRPQVCVITEHITMTEFPASSSTCSYKEYERGIRRSSSDIRSMKDTEALSEKDETGSIEFSRQ